MAKHHSRHKYNRSRVWYDNLEDQVKGLALQLGLLCSIRERTAMAMSNMDRGRGMAGEMALGTSTMARLMDSKVRSDMDILGLMGIATLGQVDMKMRRGRVGSSKSIDYASCMT